MNPDRIAGWMFTVILHALVLFGWRIGTPAVPLALDDRSVEVSLVSPPPPQPEDVPPPPQEEPRPPPEPEVPPPAPEPPPTPMPERTPVPDPKPPPPPREVPKPASERHSTPKPSVLPPATPRPPAPALASPGPTIKASPRYRSNPKPAYPPDARRLKQQGLVLLDVEVSADGHPSSVSLKSSSGVPSLDQAAIQAVRRWSFDPSRAGGIPVASRVEVPVRFSLSN